MHDGFPFLPPVIGHLGHGHLGHTLGHLGHTLGTPSLIFSAISSQTTYILCWEFLFEQYVTGFWTVKNMWWNCNWNTMLCKESIRRNVPLMSTWRAAKKRERGLDFLRGLILNRCPRKIDPLCSFDAVDAELADLTFRISYQHQSRTDVPGKLTLYAPFLCFLICVFHEQICKHYPLVLLTPGWQIWRPVFLMSTNLEQMCQENWPYIRLLGRW